MPPVRDAAAGPACEALHGGEARRFIEPAREHGAGAQARGFAGENDEDRLRHVLRVARIAGEPQGDGIDEGDVARTNSAKAGSELPAGVFPHQVHVVRV